MLDSASSLYYFPYKPFSLGEHRHLTVPWEGAKIDCCLINRECLITSDQIRQMRNTKFIPSSIWEIIYNLSHHSQAAIYRRSCLNSKMYKTLKKNTLFTPAQISGPVLLNWTVVCVTVHKRVIDSLLKTRCRRYRRWRFALFLPVSVGPFPVDLQHHSPAIINGELAD